LHFTLNMPPIVILNLFQDLTGPQKNTEADIEVDDKISSA